MPIPEYLLVEQERVLHPMTNTKNPVCKRCGFRTYPLWGEHDCQSLPDNQKMRHIAAQVLSQLSFYRVPAEAKVFALCRALAVSLATDVPDTERALIKWRKLSEEIDALIIRIGSTVTNDNPVQQAAKTTLRKKVKHVSMRKVSQTKRMQKRPTSSKLR